MEKRKSKVKFKVQGHEKFPLRDGWLNKGLKEIPKNPKVFLDKEGPDIFGIGNNMVKSLRYWMKAFGLIHEVAGVGASLTSMGGIIAEEDLYLEDNFTLWVLHSFIAKNKEDATSWYMYFNKCDSEDLTKEQIEKILFREIEKYVEGQKFADKSVKNDVDVLLAMYSRSDKCEDPEDKSVSPFSTLHIVKNNDGKYSKNHPDRRTFNEWNVLYELAIQLNGKESISIEKFIHDECGLSAIYHLTSVASNEYLDRLDTMGYIRVDRTAGLDMIYKVKDILPEGVMKEYYKKHR